MSMDEIHNRVNDRRQHISASCKDVVTMIFAGLLLITSLGLASTVTLADDGAASIAAGGIVMAREPRITMQKEVLRIGTRQVEVDYEFRNDTDADITTEIAFPVPSYSLGWDQHTMRESAFEDFQLSVEGEHAHFAIEVKAKLRGRDVTAILKKYGIDVASFGHFSEESHFAKDIRRLSKVQRAALIRAGLLYPEADQDEGVWRVEKKYYWQQTFPARSVIHISHQYTPVLGNSNTIGDPAEYNPRDKKDAEFATLCPTPALIDTLKHMGQTSSGTASMSYVDFILTTANTWKTPIEDFTLIVERPKQTRTEDKETFVSFCWDGPVGKIDADHFSAHTKDLVPRKELKVGFITPY